MPDTQIENYCKYIIIRTFKTRALEAEEVYIAMVAGFVDGYDHFQELENESIEAFKMAGKMAMIRAREEFKHLQENAIPMTSLKATNTIAIKAKEYSAKYTKDNGNEYNEFMDHNLRAFYAFGFEAGYFPTLEEGTEELYSKEIEITRTKLKNNNIKLDLFKNSRVVPKFKIERRK